MWINWQYCKMSIKIIHKNLKFIKCNIRWKIKGGHWCDCCIVRASSKVQQKLQLIVGKGVEAYGKLHPKSRKNNQPFTFVNIWEIVGTSFTCLWQGWYSIIFSNQVKDYFFLFILHNSNFFHLNKKLDICYGTYVYSV